MLNKLLEIKQELKNVGINVVELKTTSEADVLQITNTLNQIIDIANGLSVDVTTVIANHALDLEDK